MSYYLKTAAKVEAVKRQCSFTELTIAPATQGLLWGMLGVLMFSGGIPATRLAVAELPVLFVGSGRAFIAAILSVLLLMLFKQAFPAKKHWPAIFKVAFGAVLAYPLLSAVAMQQIESSHGVLLSSVLPLFTAIFGAWLTRQWPRYGFWLCALFSTLLVIGYALWLGAGQFSISDVWLLLACFCCGYSYAKGAVLAKDLGSWQVICWALVFSLPVLMPLTFWFWPHGAHVGWPSWLGFTYLAVFSMFLGFFAWYKGLALGGVAKISQLQLLTPFLAFFMSASWLGEQISILQWLLALLVVVLIALGRRLA